MSTRRFRVEPGSLAGEFAELAREEDHHLRVMRLQAGTTVELFDGEGNGALGVLEEVAPDHVRVRVVGAVVDAAESPVAVTLVQAVPVKIQRLDTTVRLCTELGVREIIPVVGARSQVPAGGSAVLGRRAERWRRIAESAAKQCGRTVVPRIAPVVPLPEIRWTQLPTSRFLLQPTAVRSLAAALRSSQETRCAIFVGPEGGWDAAERSLLHEEGGAAVALGPRVLRADSAGPAALALVQAVWGDLA